MKDKDTFELCSYYSKLNDLIISNKKNLCKQFKTDLYSKNVKYPIYEFNGEKLNHLNKNVDYKLELFDYKNEICKKFYYKKNNELRRAAKIFYYLTISNDKKEEKKYRIEVRFKGELFTAAPQFHFHEIGCM